MVTSDDNSAKETVRHTFSADHISETEKLKQTYNLDIFGRGFPPINGCLDKPHKETKLFC